GRAPRVPARDRPARRSLGAPRRRRRGRGERPSRRAGGGVGPGGLTGTLRYLVPTVGGEEPVVPAQPRSEAMMVALRLVAPGTQLREGLDRILQARMGALIVVGDGPDVLSVCSGGFLLDAEFTPQRLSELAKMDGAIILASDTSRVARANVHLVPDPTIPTSETGTP